MKMVHIIGAASLTLIVSACTWVNENEAGQSVAITDINQVNKCQKVGNINVKTKHKVGFIKRGTTKVTKELQVLARNEAIKLGANTIVANSEPVDGQQRYQAFVCVR